MTINIARDQGPPEFQRLPYSKSIDHDHPLNSLVQETPAIDRDLKGQLMYRIIGDVPATSFFALRSEQLGGIVLKNDLRMDSLNTERYIFVLLLLLVLFVIDLNGIWSCKELL